jgi:hypothetical protein
MTGALIGIGIIIFVLLFFGIMGRKGSKTNFYLQYTAEGLALVKHRITEADKSSYTPLLKRNIKKE